MGHERTWGINFTVTNLEENFRDHRLGVTAYFRISIKCLKLGEVFLFFLKKIASIIMK